MPFLPVFPRMCAPPGGSNASCLSSARATTPVPECVSSRQEHASTTDHQRAHTPTARVSARIDANQTSEHPEPHLDANHMTSKRRLSNASATRQDNSHGCAISGASMQEAGARGRPRPPIDSNIPLRRVLLATSPSSTPDAPCRPRPGGGSGLVAPASSLANCAQNQHPKRRARSPTIRNVAMRIAQGSGGP